MTGSAGPEIAATSLTGNHAKPVATDPKTTSRAEAFELSDGRARSDGDVFQNAGRDAAGQAQSQTRPEIQHAALLLHRQVPPAGSRNFTMLPVGRELVQYSSIAVNTIVQNIKPERSAPAMCPSPVTSAQFNEDYLRLTRAGGRNLREPRSDRQHGHRHIRHRGH